jgi:hypothetical protein
MNCAFHAFMKASGLRPLDRGIESSMESYYSSLRHVTSDGDTGIYVGCAQWALSSTIDYAFRCGWIKHRMWLSMWYADWVSMSELVRHAEGHFAREITRTWFHLARMVMPTSEHYRFIVFDLATGHASYGPVAQAQFPMAAIWVTKKGVGP